MDIDKTLFVENSFSPQQTPPQSRTNSVSKEYAVEQKTEQNELIVSEEVAPIEQKTEVKQKFGGYKAINGSYGVATRFKKGDVTRQRNGARKTHEIKTRKMQNKELVMNLIGCTPKIPPATAESLRKMGITGQLNGNGQNEYTIELIAAAAMIQKAMKGDIKAYELMLSIIGQKPIETVMLTTDASVSKKVQDTLFGPEQE